MYEKLILCESQQIFTFYCIFSAFFALNLTNNESGGCVLFEIRFSFGRRTGTIFEKLQSWRLLFLFHWPVELHEWDAGFGEEFFG